MSSRPSSAGPLVAIAGAALLSASLWLPWYELRVPDAIRDAFRSFGEGTGGVTADKGNPFGQMLQGLAAAIPPSVEVSGWQGLEQADVALAVLASLALVVGLISGGILGPSVRADAGAAGRVMALTGAVGLAISGFHVVTRPMANFPGASDFVDIQQGVWVAVAGSALILAGGLIALSAAGRSEPVTSDGWSSSSAGVGSQPANATQAVVPGGRAVSGEHIAAGAPPATAAETPIYTATPSASLAPPGWR